LLAAGSYAGIIYDNTTDDISSSSGTMTIDGSPVGGGTHPVNLASDVTGELPHGSTSDDVSQVHGLGANVNVLGDRDASGHFVESATITTTALTSNDFTLYGATRAVTFATAYSATPVVVVGGAGGASNHWGSAVSIGTTGFTMQLFGSGTNTRTTDYISIGT